MAPYREKETFFGIIVASAALGERTGVVSPEKIASALKVKMPTAIKAYCALEVMGLLGEVTRKKRVYTGKAGESARIAARKEEFPQDYFPLVEDASAFSEVGAAGYIGGTLLPALKAGMMYGSLSVIFIERKLGVPYERAREIFDIIAAAGLLGDEDEFNPGRRLMNFGFADYDALFARLVADGLVGGGR